MDSQEAQLLVTIHRISDALLQERTPETAVVTLHAVTENFELRY
jgi:hypothetical protein